MPLNTRVGRCVTKLRKKYGYGKAIGICQHSTKQNYLTGKNGIPRNDFTICSPAQLLIFFETDIFFDSCS